MCTAYYSPKLNTIIDSFSLPTIDKLLVYLHCSKGLLKVYLCEEYYKIPIAVRYWYLTAFNYRYSDFEFMVIKFGLENTPWTRYLYVWLMSVY